MPEFLHRVKIPVEISDTGNESVPVSMQDQVTPPVDVWFAESKGEVTTATPSDQGSHIAELLPGHGAVVGDIIEARTADNYVQAKILSVVTNTITLSTPLSRDFPAGTVVALGSPEMNVLGTRTTPRIFAIRPSAVQRVHINRILMILKDGTAMDYSTFGGAPKLATGVTLRKLQEDGTFHNYFAWQDNGEITARSFDFEILAKVTGGDHAAVVRSTWNGADKRGVSIELDGAKGEQLQLVIPDDLTVLTEFAAVAQGHIVQEATAQ